MTSKPIVLRVLWLGLAGVVSVAAIAGCQFNPRPPADPLPTALPHGTAAAYPPPVATPPLQPGYPPPGTPPTQPPTQPPETEFAQMTASAPSPAPAATSSIRFGSQVIEDPAGQYRFQLLPGWWASVSEYSSAILFNYDPETHVNTFDPGDLKVTIGFSRLGPGQSFDAWVADWVAANSQPYDPPQPTLVHTVPAPYELNGYSGVTFEVEGIYRSQSIVLAVDAERILVISLSPLADSPALAEALQMLATLEILPAPPT